ncbi:MAG: hypothetical protein ACAH80_06990 [Alphaproteobacteria bacterium]
MLQWLTKKVEKVNEILAEGNYRVPPMSWGRLIKGMKPELPATSEVAVGTTMIDSGKSLGTRFMWASLIALLSINTLMWAAVGFGAVGIAIYTAEYFRAKKSRSDELIEINFAGQRVKGQRSDLYRLHRAQLKIMNISDSLSSGTNTTADAIASILDTVKEERKRVKVLEGGRYGASTDAYGFTEPDFRLLFDENDLKHKNEPEVKKPEPELQPLPAVKGDLTSAWNSKRMTSDDFVEQLATLQESLPPEVADKLQQRLKAGKASAPGA